MIACCPIINVLLENDVKDKQGEYEGVYTFQGFTNGLDYWVDAEGNNAIWHSTGTENQGVRWRIGPHEKLGLVGLGNDPAVGIYSEKKDQKECPNNEGFVWIWYYNQGGTTFIATNDVYIECANENSRRQTIHESLLDYRKMQNPRKSSISKNARHKKGMMSGLRPQNFVRNSKLSSTPDFSKHSMYFGQEDRMFRSRTQHFGR